MSDHPEEFLEDVAYLLDAAETGEKGCLLPQLDDPKEDTDEPDDE